MALPPTIPTSFVPHPSMQTGPRRMRPGDNVLLAVSLVLVGLTIVGSGAVFGYQKYLEKARDSKQAELAQKQQSINQDTIQDFVRLHNRLIQAKTLLSQHVALSQFFDTLESITLQNVRFTSLEITIGQDHSAQMTMSGSARTFNALAAQSALFATQKYIKHAIFSGITVNKDNTVAFLLRADVDSALVLEQSATSTSSAAALPAPVAPAAPVASTTVPAITATSTASKAASTTPTKP